LSKPVYYIKELILMRQKGAEMQNLRNGIHVPMRYYSQIRQNVVRTQKCHWCSYHNLTFSIINCWTDTQQYEIYFCIPVIKEKIMLLLSSIPSLSSNRPFTPWLVCFPITDHKIFSHNFFFQLIFAFVSRQNSVLAAVVVLYLLVALLYYYNY